MNYWKVGMYSNHPSCPYKMKYQCGSGRFDGRLFVNNKIQKTTLKSMKSKQLTTVFLF